MLPKKSLVYKQVLFFLILAFNIILVLSVYFYNYSRNAIINRTYEQLTAIRETKKNQIEQIFNERLNDLQFISSSSAMKSVYQNLTAVGQGNDIIKDTTGFHNYGIVNLHFMLPPVNNNTNYKFYSLHDTAGSIGNAAPENITGIMKQLWESDLLMNKSFHISDYLYGSTGDNIPVMLVAGVFKPDDKTNDSVLLAFEITSSSITNTLVRYSAEMGFGYSGEAYIIGEDLRMRSGSRFIEDAVMKVKVNSEAARKAVNGEEGRMLTNDYRNVKVYSSFAPLYVHGLKWAVLSEIDREEAIKSIISMRNDIILLTIVISLFVVSLSVFFTMKIVNPVRKLEKAANILGKGDFNIRVNNDSADEIGSLSRSFNQMADKLSEMTSELVEREQRLNHFYEATLEGIIIYDKEQTPLLINKALLKITAYTEDELKKLPLNKWIKNYTAGKDFFETTLITARGEHPDAEIQNSTLFYKQSEVIVIIVRDITLRKKAEKALAEERKERFSALLDGQELERQRLSRELHDGLGQKLAGIKLKLENFTYSPDGKIQPLIGGIKENLSSSIEELRRISYDLRSPDLTEFGLIVSLGNLCREFGADAGINCEFSCFGNWDGIPQMLSTYLYRICQEGLNNVARHAGASMVNLQLISNASSYIVMLEDNGKGFVYSPEKQPKGNGLYNMQQRVALLNGNITVESAPGLGTTVRIKVPKEKNEALSS